MLNSDEGIESCIFTTQCCITLKFQTMSSIRWNNLNLKYQRFTRLGSTAIWIWNLLFVAKTQFLSPSNFGYIFPLEKQRSERSYKCADMI